MLRLSFLAAAAALMLAPVGASALSVSAIDATGTWIDANLSTAPAATLAIPAGAQWTTTNTAQNTPGPRVVSGSTSVYRSPFDGSTRSGLPANTPTTNWQSIQYFVVGPNPNDPSTAKLEFSVEQTSMSFLWGSPDSYNELRFFSGANFVGTVNGSNPGIGGFADIPASETGVGAAYVTISGLAFDEVHFVSSNAQAFEFSNLSFTPIPLPAAAWLLIAGIAGFGVFRRKATA